MSSATSWLRVAIVIMLALVPALAAGTTIEQLEQSGHLQIDSTIEPRNTVVPGQKLQLTLTVATDTWFTGGTRIAIPEVPGLVILQNEQFAANASENRMGKTWVVQRWTLDVFPQQAGDFTIPPISLQLKINGGAATEIEGSATSPALAFSTTIPDALTDVEHWVAAPVFEISQSFSRSLQDLQVGDAFEREIRFQAQDVMAMMLPAFEAEEFEGLAAYPAPPQLNNNVNRGQASASREVRISYVVESPGLYRLPALEYFWWNTVNDELQLLSLPETMIEVAGTGSAEQSGVAAPAISTRQLLLVLAGFTLLAIALRLAWLYLPRLPLARGSAAIAQLRSRWRELRRPALPSRLNPGNNAGD